MKDENQKSILDSWDAFSGEWLKADDVSSSEDEYACINVEAREENGKQQLVLYLERNEICKLFQLNATNRNVLRGFGCTSPRQLIGMGFKFDKVKVTNPQTKQLVNSLVIKSVRSL